MALLEVNHLNISFGGLPQCTPAAANPLGAQMPPVTSLYCIKILLSHKQVSHKQARPLSQSLAALPDSPFCRLRDIFPRHGGSLSSQGELSPSGD